MEHQRRNGDFLKDIPPVISASAGTSLEDYAGIVKDTCVIKAGFAGESLGHVRLALTPKLGRSLAGSARFSSPIGKEKAGPILLPTLAL